MALTIRSLFLNFEKLYDEVERALFKRLKISKSSESFARSVITRDVDAYINLKISKGGKGKTRQISAPLIELSKIQKAVLEMLEGLVQTPPKGKRLIHPAAHAYRKYHSHTSAASVHLGMKWGVKVDLQRFYDHITEEHVYRVLEDAGLEGEAYFLSKLCTRVPYNWPEGLPQKYTRFQRTLTKPVPDYVYDPKDRWFAELLPNRILASRIRRRSATKEPSAGTVFRILPPKKIYRIFLHIATGRVKILDLKNLEVQLLFERVKNVFGFIRNDEKKRKFNELLKSSRKKWRTHIIEKYEDRFAFSHAYGDERQRYYPVRPEQYRMRTKVGYLPQGSPASGLISNLVMAKFDEVMFEFCMSNNFRYTRYSDDIVVSSTDGNFSRDRALKIVAFIQKLSEFNGFSLNKDKTRIMTPGSRKYILGVLVDGPSLRLGKHERERIERMIYQIAKFGDFWSDKPPAMHLLNQSHSLPGKRVGSFDFPRTPSDPLASLLGWLSYCKTADLEFLKKTHSSMEERKWGFMNANHRQAILTLTSQLLGLSSDKAVSSDGNDQSKYGVHWNSQLSDSHETEPDAEDDNW